MYTLWDSKEEEFFKNNAAILDLWSKIRKDNERHPLFDLTSFEQEKQALQLAELVLQCSLVDTSSADKLAESIAKLHEFEFHCFHNMRGRGNSKLDYGLLFFLAFNNARSRLNMLLLKEKKIKSHVTVIVPMWGEQNRMQSKETHKAGEDFLRRKVNQLDWLYRDMDAELMDWNLMFVDDGCPHGSGKEALKMMDGDKDFFTDSIRGKISVEFLEEGLQKIDKFKNDANLNNVNDSRKGGAVQYGMYLALNRKMDAADKQHFVMYTDADLSTNISQTGLLLADITMNNESQQRQVVIGDRYEKGIFSHGYVMGTFKTNEVALKLRSIFRGHLMPPFKKLYDTQTGFKIFTKRCIERVLPELKEYTGMFDMELLLKSFEVSVRAQAADADAAKDDEKKQKEAADVDVGEIIYSTGVVWLHSTEETNFGEFTDGVFTVEYGWKHYNQLKEMISIYNNNFKDSALCDKQWVQWILDLSWKDYFHLCQIVYCQGIDVYKWHPTLDDLQKMIKEEKYPEKAPAFVEDPSKK